ncbi:acyl carrier protein [Streptomyces sp. NBC_01136]|uniref:acyl carrier protein n=1 Tax=unclassified Streptomyces TaxID=2593676 RepID=UPI003250C55E|nr:acyl carrier protein [Streptomyces sp. NBC_01136]WST81117.1 acyl carrier protein [Streptomyces sp. NBC_01136]
MSPERTAGLAGFLDAVRDGLGLDLTEEQAAADFDLLPDWDSVHLLRLVMLLERETGRSIPVSRVLQARSLHAIHQLVTTDGRDTR